MSAKPFRLFSRQNLFAAGFFVFLIVFLWLTVSILSPFLRAFLWAMILAMVFYPLYQRVYIWFGKRETLAALVVTPLVLAMLVFPGFFILVNLGHELTRMYELISNTPWESRTAWVIEKIRMLNLEDNLQRWGLKPEQVESMVRDGIQSGLQNLSALLIGKTSGILKNITAFGVHAFFVAVALFFFFRDGLRFSRRIIDLLPMEYQHQDKIVKTFSVTVSAVVRGMFITAIVQAFLGAIGFAAAGVPLPILLAALIFITSFIPFLGAASVWVPAAIWLISQNHMGAGVGLALWGLLVISTSDNILKPMIIGEKTNLPTFFLFFTILGGLKVYGFLGVFLGPIILAMGMAFLSIYKDVYLTRNRPQRKTEKS